MTTKERILQTALALFNRDGIDLITTRHIAKEMGISHGNLCYHFTKKEDIIYALYQQLVSEFDRQIIAAQGREVSLEMMLHSLELIFTAQYQHRFLMLDFAGVMRRIEPIRTHFKALFIQRKAQLSFILQQLVRLDYLKPEPIEGYYDRVVLVQLYILVDFWLSEAEILYEGEESQKLKYYVTLIFSVLVPLLTEKGMEEYKRLVG